MIIRHERLIQTITEGSTECKNPLGKPHLEYIMQVEQDVIEGATEW